MADYSNALIGTSFGIQASAEIGTAYAQSQALQAQGQFAQTMANINAKFADVQADQALRQGDRQATLLRQRGVQVQGAQRASAAAQGIRVDDGSAADLVDQTRTLSADDQITARNNAWREAFGIKTQAQFNVSQANMQARANNNAATGTLIGGLLQGGATAMKATGYGLKAFRDNKTPERTDMLTVKSRPATEAQNEYFNHIFSDLDPDQRNA